MAPSLLDLLDGFIERVQSANPNKDLFPEVEAQAAMMTRKHSEKRDYVRAYLAAIHSLGFKPSASFFSAVASTATVVLGLTGDDEVTSDDVRQVYAQVRQLLEE